MSSTYDGKMKPSKVSLPFFAISLALVHQPDEFFFVFGQKPRPLFEAYALRAVASVVGDVAGGLVGEEFDFFVVVERVLQEVYDVAFVGYREGFARRHRFFRPSEGFRKLFSPFAYPALAVARLYARRVYFGYYRRRSSYFGGFRLGSTHAAESRGDEEVSSESPAFLKVEHFAPRVEQRVVCAVHYALRAYVHPAAGCHLTVVGDSQRGRSTEVVGVVEEADHEAVGQYHARRGGVRTEEPQRMPGLHDERLVFRHDFKIFFD